MSRRHSTGPAPKDMDTEEDMMAVLPEGPNSSFRRHRRMSAPDQEVETPRRMSVRHLKCQDQEDDWGKMRRTLTERKTDPMKVTAERTTDDGHLSERFQSSRTNQSQAVNDVAKPKLDRISLFQQCTPTFLQALSHQLENTVFDKGQVIMKQGDIGTNMFLLNFGEVEVVVGEAEIVVATLGSGALFGEMAVISKNSDAAKRTATIRAKCYCHCWSIDRAALLKLFTTYPKDELVVSAEANRKLQDLIKKGLVKDPGLEKKDAYRHSVSAKEGWSTRVRGKIKSITGLARLGRQTFPDEHGQHSERRTFDEAGRDSYDTARGTFDSSRRTYDDLGRNTYESSRPSYNDHSRPSYNDNGRSSYESTCQIVGRQTFDDDPESTRLTYDEERRTNVSESSCGAAQRRTPRSGVLNSSDDPVWETHNSMESKHTLGNGERRAFPTPLGKENLIDDGSSDRRSIFSGYSSKANRPKLCKSTVASLLQNPVSQDRERDGLESTDPSPRSVFSPSESESGQIPCGWVGAESPARRLPPLTPKDNSQRSTRKGWDVGETSEVAKVRSTAQSFLVKRGIKHIEGAQEKSIPIDMLFNCLPSSSGVRN